jgi:hypothetical protein
MTDYLVKNPHAAYRFLPGSDPYSSGVIANPGHEITHCRLLQDLPWRDGLERIRKHVEANGLTHHAICGIELRCPAPHSLDGFGSFNKQYFALLDEWDMLVDGQNPIARTNVSPVVSAPGETMLYGFSHLTPSTRPGTFIVAGGGELPHGELARKHIVRVGETTPDAMQEKVQCVVRIMQTRLKRLGADPGNTSRIAVYCAREWGPLIESEIISGLPGAARIGVTWFHARPPVEEIEFEMDIHGVYRDEVV